MLSNHDVIRHATRYGLPQKEDPSNGVARRWLLSNGTSPRLDRGLGLRRARAAILLVMALPGSTYLYQGEELGLSEVADIPPTSSRIRSSPGPRARRKAGTAAGSVPLPHGIVIVTSAPVEGNRLPADTTAWILNGSLAA